jgi:hypothetical protein
MSAILPNELVWVNGEFWNWKPDDTCVGLFCQRCECRPWIIRYIDAQERAFNRYLSQKRQTDFLEKLVDEGICKNSSRQTRKHRPSTRNWSCESVDEIDFREIPSRPWWRKVRNLSISSRKCLEERVASLCLNQNRDWVPDQYIGEEIARGDWD